MGYVTERYSINNKIFNSIIHKTVGKSVHYYICYPMSPTHFAVGALRFNPDSSFSKKRYGLYSEDLITWREVFLYKDRRRYIKISAFFSAFNYYDTAYLTLFVLPNYQSVDRRIREIYYSRTSTTDKTHLTLRNKERRIKCLIGVSTAVVYIISTHRQGKENLI